MKRLLFLLSILVSFGVVAQPVLRNSWTTNQTGRTPNVLPTSTNVIYPLMVLNPDGSGTDRQVLYSQYLTMVGTNMFVNGVQFGSSNTTNTYNTINVTNLNVINNLTATNLYVSNITVQNNLTVSNLYTVNGNHNTLIVTQYVRMPWTTLTMSGSNVSSIDFAAANMFKLTLTNNGFFVAPSNLPGTNIAQTIQVHVAQDATGTRTLTLTNGSWVMAGSGASTNAVVGLNTNASAVTVLTFATSPFSATKVYGVVAATGQ